MQDGQRDRPELWQPRYGYSEADYLADVSKGTSKRWIEGYEYKRDGTTIAMPAVTPRPEQKGALSFIDLVEVAAIGRLKKFGFSLQKIRNIVLRCRAIYGAERPLATLKFKIGGGDAFVDDGEILTAVGGKNIGERAWHDILAPFLNELEYGVGGVAERWWPLGRGHVVVVDPDYGFGLPVVRGSGVRVEIISERIGAGDLPSEIAHDFNLSEQEISAALQFQMMRRAA